MSIRQTYIATSEAVPGMRLARPLSKVFNHRLFQLHAGTELTEDLIRQMAIRDIHCLIIEQPDSRSDAQREQDCARIEAECRRIFAEADLTRPAVAGLYATVLEYRKVHS